MDTVRRKLLLVTIGTQRVNKLYRPRAYEQQFTVCKLIFFFLNHKAKSGSYQPVKS